jgi:hypothetical protein
LAFNKECMSHARECVRLAGLTENKTIRDQLLDMAQRWTAAGQSQRRSDDARVVSLHKLRKQTKPRRRKPSSSGLEKVQKGSAGAKRH